METMGRWGTVISMTVTKGGTREKETVKRKAISLSQLGQ